MEDNMNNNNNNLYNILNNFNKLSESDTPKPANQSKPKTLLESTMEQVMQEKYMGFKKTVGALKKQGGIEDPEALAASIGRKKYGKKAFQKAAAAGKKMGESAPHPKELEMDAKVRSMQIQNRADAVEKRRAEKAKEPQNVFQKAKKDIGEPLAKLAKGDIKGAFSENRDAYQRDYDSSVSGMGTDHEFRNRERNAGLEDEKNNYAVYIDGRQWKVFADRRQAENIARSLTNKGKKAEVYVTGANVSEESDWSNLGAEYRSTKPGTKEPTHTGEKEYFKGGVKHTKDYDREVSHTAATGEKRGRGRPKKSQFEGHYTIDQLIAEAFGEEDQEQSLNYEQDQLRNAIGDDLFAELQRSVRNGDYDFSDDLFQALYDHYFDDMPYGAKTGEDIDTSEWIGDRIGEVFADDVQEQAETFPVQDRRSDIQGTDIGPIFPKVDVRGFGPDPEDLPAGNKLVKPIQPLVRDVDEGNWQDIDDRSAPVKGANQKIKTIEPGSAIRVDPNYKDPTTTKAPTKSPSMMDKVTQSAGRTPPYMPEKPTKADNGMGRIVQGTWQADPKGTVKAPSGDPEGVQEADDPFADDPFFNTKSKPEAEIRTQQKTALDKNQGTSLKTMNPIDRDQYLNNTGRTWDEKTQRSVPAQQKPQQEEDIMMTNELSEMMRLAGMTESKGTKPDYLDFDKDGDKKEPMKQALKDKKVDESEEKTDKDYDGDGKIESGKDEYLGSKIAAAKKAGKLKEGEKVKEERCDECGMYESKCKCDESMSEALNQMRRIAGLKECDMSPISGAAGDMQQQQGKMNISTNMDSDGHKSVTITADGDSALELMQMLKLAGMGDRGGEEMHQHEEPEGIMVVAHDGEESHEEEVDETKDPRYHANTTPEEHVYPEQVLTRGGNGEVAGRNKQMHKDGYQFGDNPMAMKESMGLKFMKEYEGIKVKNENTRRYRK